MLINNISFIFNDSGAPMMNTAGAQPAPVTSQAPMVPSFQDVRPGAAWNDPPMVSSRKKQVMFNGL